MMGVPNLPGVPALAAYVPIAPLADTLLTGDTFDFGLSSILPQWGFFLGGLPVVLCDNVVSFAYKQEFAISDFPVEEGGFESYDKVQIPFDVRFRFSTGGSIADRAAMIASIQAVIGDTNFYTAVTPEAVYDNINFTHWNYDKAAAAGNGLLIIDVWAFEVRVAGTTSPSSQFQDTAQPDGASPQPGGTVQSTPTGNVGPPTAGNADQPGFVGGQGSQPIGGPPTFQ